MFLTCLQLVGTWGAKCFQGFGPRFFDMSSASGYVGETYYVQEFGPRCLGAYPLLGTCIWVLVHKNIVNAYWLQSVDSLLLHALAQPDL